MKVALVYNQFCLASTIGAAIAQTELRTNELFDLRTYSLANNIPSDADLYIWLGTDGYDVLKRSEAKHICILKDNDAGNNDRLDVSLKSIMSLYGKATDGIKPLADSIVKKLTPEKTTVIHGTLSSNGIEVLSPEVLEAQEVLPSVPVMDISDDDEGVASPSLLIVKMCMELDIDLKKYICIAYHAENFFSQDTELEYLTMVYMNLNVAKAAIYSGVPYVPETRVTVTDTEHYLLAVSAAKGKLDNNYKVISHFEGKVMKAAAFTAYNGEDFHLTLRAIRMAHRWYMNVSVGMNGYLVYTNLNNPSPIDIMQSGLILH